MKTGRSCRPQKAAPGRTFPETSLWHKPARGPQHFRVDIHPGYRQSVPSEGFGK